MSSRPIPIKSPRDNRTGIFSSARLSQSMPVVPRSPHFGSLKAPPAFTDNMPEMQLPSSIHVQAARSLPANDLEPRALHSYSLRDNGIPADKLLSSSIVLSSSLDQLSSSFGKIGLGSLKMNKLKEEEEEETQSPQPQEKKGVVLETLLSKVSTTLKEEDEADDVVVSSDEGEEFFVLES